MSPDPIPNPNPTPTATAPRPRAGDRSRFVAALILFAAWVAALGAMAYTSSEKPPAPTKPAGPRATAPPVGSEPAVPRP